MKKLLVIALLILFIAGCGSKKDSMILNIIGMRTPAQKAKDHCLKKAEENIKSGEYKKAEEYLMKALKVDEKDPIIYHKLGILYELMGEDNKSISYYLKAIKIDPGLSKIEKNR